MMNGKYRLDGKMRNSYRILVGKLLQRPSMKWEVGINFNLEGGSKWLRIMSKPVSAFEF